MLACGCEAGDGAVVGRGARRGRVNRWRPQALVAEEALDAFRVTDESAQFHAAAAGRALVDGEPERQT